VHASVALLMRARHPSVCAGCGRDIRAGDEIVRDRGPWVHRECSQVYKEITRRSESADSLRSYEEMKAHERGQEEEERHEDFYVHDALWDRVCPDDNAKQWTEGGVTYRVGTFVICIGCFEERLGRRLARSDLSPRRNRCSANDRRLGSSTGR
jgi:hypothetical protein